MPRKPDAELESRILSAAYKLWSNGGKGPHHAGGGENCRDNNTDDVSEVSEQERPDNAAAQASSRTTRICLAAGLFTVRDLRTLSGFRHETPARVPVAHGGLGCAPIAPGTAANI